MDVPLTKKVGRNMSRPEMITMMISMHLNSVIASASHLVKSCVALEWWRSANWFTATRLRTPLVDMYSVMISMLIEVALSFKCSGRFEISRIELRAVEPTLVFTCTIDLQFCSHVGSRCFKGPTLPRPVLWLRSYLARLVLNSSLYRGVAKLNYWRC